MSTELIGWDAKNGRLQHEVIRPVLTITPKLRSRYLAGIAHAHLYGWSAWALEWEGEWHVFRIDEANSRRTFPTKEAAEMWVAHIGAKIA